MNETREQRYDLRQKQVIRGTGLSKQCTDTHKDSNDAARHKLRRTLAYNFDQFHLSLHLQFDLLIFYQDLQCDSTAEPDSNICLEVRASKLTNSWIRGSWWRRDASADEHTVGTKHGVLKFRSVRRKPLGEQWSWRETIEARGTKWNFDVEMDFGTLGPTLEPRWDEGMSTGSVPIEIPRVPSLAPPPEEQVLEMRGQRVHAKAFRFGALWSEIRRTPGCLACETPGPGKSHTRECKTSQDVWKIAAEQHQRRKRDAELLEIRTLDRSTPVRVQQISTRRDQNNFCDRQR